MIASAFRKRTPSWASSSSSDFKRVIVGGVLRQAIGEPTADAEPLGGLLKQRLQVERDGPTLG